MKLVFSELHITGGNPTGHIYLHCQIQICVSCLFGETGASIMGVRQARGSLGYSIIKLYP